MWKVLRKNREQPLHLITMDQAKLQLRLTHNHQDALIEEIIEEASDWVERYSGRSLAPCELVGSASNWDEIEEISKGPVRKIVSVKYIDEFGNLKELEEAQAHLDNRELTANIYFTGELPLVDTQRHNAIEITMTAGYNADELPHIVKNAVRLTASTIFLNGGDYVDERNTFAKNQIKAISIPHV
ncbi:phage head-tail connector protein [Halosquirtibacter laminarini]|uniref:Phage head-tail connector protein n=1 Tax=Halosquirtibacter laminarini TaxID=3374600 RepID=A0AC61NI60_9BACT|nr:phage head-tail connector protein [Prolixibacteraceae bacterium]